MCLVLILWLRLGQFSCLPNPLIPIRTSVHGADYTNYIGTKIEGSGDSSSSQPTRSQFEVLEEVDGN